ncbi:YTH domain-containing protein ECT4-like isoform X1 [Populus nigra]|uniref:YTH domain-containing protein ECT4-like isoform X1 n=2 Tax=Populus nigra TaxID=3691 RepID=UPI002B27A334|nr:YTH domain-containing protein ECT4-like isoform X1 [Populus nigra]XP_061986245.1 YTH domain-containing protein ECT4-like isoform X1 [Populus nigra]
MVMSNVSGHENAETYSIQGAEVNPILTSPAVELVETMYSEGTPGFVADQGLFYPAATEYGYYCTGFETPVEWEDHQKIFGADGPEIQYAGAQTEYLPYVYYAPSYAYAQSPYNPYNPYIPGAMIGVDGPYAGEQQYYTVPPYQDPVSSSGYIPVVVQPEAFQNGSADPLLDTSIARNSRPDGKSFKHGISSSSAAFAWNPPRPASNQTNSLNRISEWPKANVGPVKQSHGGVSSGSILTQASSHVLQGRSASGPMHPIDNISNSKVRSHQNQLKVTLPVSNDFSNFGSSAYGRTSVDKLRSKFHAGRTLSALNGNVELLGEQNRGPRINNLKNQPAVKASTTKVRDNNELGNIVIQTDQYNKDDFSTNYADAKFFVIKSYSEDDVHKSIKYNVWSSTPHGNKKLHSAFEHAQKLDLGRPRGCPIFLFFSVNASGQFCGVAEMVGPVDFNRDMDFWQQDKWSGSFLVKWHIIKDIPNSSFRHIILENNENKPVTNSRDTQEIMYKQGLEMLKMFKNHQLKTSILDDFVYYENRQKIMQEEKARRMFKSFQSPLFVPALNPARELNGLVQQSLNKDDSMTDLNSLKKTEANKYEKIMNPNYHNIWKKTETNKDEKITDQNEFNSLKNAGTSATKQLSSDSNVTISSRDKDSRQDTADADDDNGPVLKIGSLDINPTGVESKFSPNAAIKSADIVTVGSMPVKVNRIAESSGYLTVGTIPLDPKSLKVDKGGALGKQGSQC